MGIHNAKRFTSILPLFLGGGHMLLLSVYFGLFAISLLSADRETGKKMHDYLTRVVFIESIAV